CRDRCNSRPGRSRYSSRRRRSPGSGTWPSGRGRPPVREELTYLLSNDGRIGQVRTAGSHRIASADRVLPLMPQAEADDSRNERLVVDDQCAQQRSCRHSSEASSGTSAAEACTPGANLGARKLTLVPAPGAVSTTSPYRSPYTWRSRAPTLPIPSESEPASCTSTERMTSGSDPGPSSDADRRVAAVVDCVDGDCDDTVVTLHTVAYGV